MYIYIYIYTLVWTREYPFSFQMTPRQGKQSSVVWGQFSRTVSSNSFELSRAESSHAGRDRLSWLMRPRPSRVERSRVSPGRAKHRRGKPSEPSGLEVSASQVFSSQVVSKQLRNGLQSNPSGFEVILK